MKKLYLALLFVAMLFTCCSGEDAPVIPDDNKDENGSTVDSTENGGGTTDEDTTVVVVEKALKPRIVVLTDISTWEPDDAESMVHLLSSADLYEIEAIIYTTGWSHQVIVDGVMNELLLPLINAYGRDLNNLKARSEQTGFEADESVQEIGYWPSLKYLTDRTMFGSRKRGMEFIGADNVSDGSEYIIKLADEDDERPLWILVWGGANTLSQSVWNVQQSRGEAGLKKFLNKLRVFTITDQDRLKEDFYDVSSHKWLRSFSDDLVFLWDESAWMAQNKTRQYWHNYETMIQPMGYLGAFYPKYVWGLEGDTPTFMYVTPNGLGNVDDPTYLSWGTYFEWSLSPDGENYCYNNSQPAPIFNKATNYYNQLYPAMFNDFAARMAWAEYGAGNRNPIVDINGDAGIEPIVMTVLPTDECILDATKSFDLEGDNLSIKWWQPIGTTYTSTVPLTGADTPVCKLTIPTDSMGKEFHIICEVTDNGTPALTSYRRVIFKMTI